MSLLHKPLNRSLVTWLLLLSLPLVGIAQEVALETTEGDENEMAEPKTAIFAFDNDVFAVRPLEDLISDALMNAPLLKVQALNVDNVSHKIRIMDREWTNYISAIATGQVGNIRYFDNLESTGMTDFRTITRENTFYSVGLHVRVPLGDFVTKSDRRALLENQLEQEKLVQDDRQIRIRDLVIRQYHELQLKVKLIDIRSKDLDFYKVAAESAEKYFREGNMTLEEYTDAITLRSKAEASLEQTKMDARLAFQLLGEIVGKDIRVN
ncbi:MAG: TolC family protein [Saprospiraceae bacterium]